jgi:hypothetical protein
MVWFLLKICSLHKITQKRSVELCITLDGPELTKDLCHLSFGVKITDPRAINPRDGTPLACQEDGRDRHWYHLCPCTGNKIASFLADLNWFVAGVFFLS